MHRSGPRCPHVVGPRRAHAGAGVRESVVRCISPAAFARTQAFGILLPLVGPWAHQSPWNPWCDLQFIGAFGASDSRGTRSVATEQPRILPLSHVVVLAA